MNGVKKLNSGKSPKPEMISKINQNRILGSWTICGKHIIFLNPKPKILNPKLLFKEVFLI